MENSHCFHPNYHSDPFSTVLQKIKCYFFGCGYIIRYKLSKMHIFCLDNWRQFFFRSGKASLSEENMSDTVFTGRSFRDYDTSLVQEWKVYYSLAFWHRERGCQGPCPISHLGLGFWRNLWGVFFIFVQVRPRDVKKIP